MKQIETDEYWKNVMEKFSRHKGTIVSFCKENNVNIHRLYNQRMKLKNKSNVTFHSINLNNISNKENKLSCVSNHTPSTEIRIEIGRAKIFLDNSDKIALSNILKEITKNC
ncbi:UNVERIFIED_CONTAM: hypothetical protein Cloal_0810 [Acetivibrio alkalicellulosi]